MARNILQILLLLAACVSSGATTSNPPEVLQRIIPAPPVGVQADAQLGRAVALDGDNAVLGAPDDRTQGDFSGVAKVFNSITGELRYLLLNPDPQSVSSFGYSVAIQGNLVAVGSWPASAGPARPGTVFVYDLSGAFPTTPIAALRSPTPHPYDRFGACVAISGTRIVVGATGDNDYTGAIYVFELASPTPTAPKITIPSPHPDSQRPFGTFRLAGTRIFTAQTDELGSPESPQVYIFDLIHSNPTQPVFTLPNPNPETQDGYGTSGAVRGNLVAVASPSHNDGGLDNGIVYLFDLSSPNPTTPVSVFHNPDPVTTRLFGSNIALSEDRLVIRFEQEDASNRSGGALVYAVNPPSPGSTGYFLPNPSPSNEDHFGNSIEISGNRVIAGASGVDTTVRDEGVAYCFTLGANAGEATYVTLAHPSAAGGDQFGSAVAMSASHIAVGSPYEDTGMQDAGSVYVYARGNSSGTDPILTYHNPVPQLYSHFGHSVAIAGSTLVIGDPDYALPGTGRLGRVYVYDLGSEDPLTPKWILENPSPVQNETFGSAVAISGNRIVVGDPMAKTGLYTPGSVYVYDLSTGSPTSPVLVLPSPSPQTMTRFGGCVVVSGGRVIVGAPSAGSLSAGRAYLFDLNGSTPTIPTTTFESLAPKQFEFFGSSIAISGDRLAIGARPYSLAGYAYVYDLASASPNAPATIIQAPEQAATGYSLGIFGNFVVVGSPSEDQTVGDTPAYESGAVRVYDLESATPTVPVSRLASSTPRSGEFFGAAIAIDGASLVIGAQSDNMTAKDKGAVYIYVPDAAITRPPVLTAPSAATVTNNLLAVAFDLPEPALPGSVKLQFTSAFGTNVLTLSSSHELSGAHSFTLDPGNPAGGADVAAGDAIADGVHVVTLEYQDQHSNPPALARTVNVLIDRHAPDITNVPAPIFVEATSEAGAVVNYQMPAATDAVGVVEFHASVPSGAVFPPGRTSVLFTAKDAAGNVATASFTVDVRPTVPVSHRLLAQGDSVPGAGTIDGIPADAKLAAFGLPAISDDGHAAFTAKWNSAAGNGFGIFRDDTLIAKGGQSMPGLPVAAAIKSIADPVISDGRVAFLATVAGVSKPQSSVVLSNATGVLDLVAQAGIPAPGTANARFKHFNSVSMDGTFVAVLAQLYGGSGNSRVTGGNDLGLWVKPGSGPLGLVLREGQMISPGKVIKTLSTLMAGQGSPGQGRGWLTRQSGIAQVLARVVFTDKSQAIIAVSLDDPSHPLVLSQSNVAAEDGSSFVSYGLPAANSEEQLAFQASFKTNAQAKPVRGIFAGLTANDAYAPLVLEGDPLGQTSVRFHLFKDPVLASDGGLAFPTTLRGVGLKGPMSQALGWIPAGEDLILIAQGGAGSTAVPGIPGSQWQSFSSLAIAPGRGPIFVASLVLGKGGVTKATSRGLWATDFKGDLRLLVQTGVTKVDGKTVKSFALLTASSGSVGSTRSFNRSAQIVWRATFSDKTHGIVVTEVP